MTDRKDIDIAELRGRLEARQAELLESSSHSEDYRKPVDLDQQAVGRLSRMDALQNQEMHLEQERRRAAELDRIKETLTRMDKDEYGHCHNCGEDIQVKRLEFDPTTPLCVDCADRVTHV
ncbi:TraR/DksA family transcriptional regulator [Thalassospira lucentensis]|uniref:TraR/DksA family transcriptional regulator n=1 Tax=Thalassospira lucentensis TaxID=168935 RepID=UPI00142DB204|nr:TraR/DksA C4-type zinc finger protein [Thalassospira lucentensis]NIZ00359.1 TraR/DksA family transcriptional regulator [Thalassospira lucentensis]